MGIGLVKVLAVLSAAALMGCASAKAMEKGPFWELPPSRHPPTTDEKLSLSPAHPRLVFHAADDAGRGRTFAEVRGLYRTDKTFKSIFDKALQVDVKRQHPAMLAACWVVTGEDRYAEAAVEKMLADPLTKSGEPYYSDVWIHALAYDWLYDHPALTKEKKEKILAKVFERLSTELAALDADGMALWHGRNQAANGTMIAALAVCDLPGQEKNLRRAAAHYIDSLRALEFSEGWPEGPSYWIYNRAGPYALAADCVMTALGTERIGGIPIRDVMRRIGLWQAYQFTPARFFEPYGDSAGSLMFGETGWWELTTDHYARLSRDPGLMAGADYLRNCSPAPYGKRPYYWNIIMTYDPTVRPKDGYDPEKPELWMREHLPQAMLFGRRSLGAAFFRTAWGDPNELYASFKAGDLMAHHDHYDAGAFTIQRGGLLAPQTGLYGPGGYTGPHRLGYSIQTVSANSLLILAPGETSGYLSASKSATRKSLSGGQRVTRPTGFSCVSLEHFREQLNAGPRLKRADITAFESVPNQYDYVAADITTAYNSTRWAEPGQAAKVSLVTRQFVFLRRYGAFVIHDRVETTDEKFLPKFLLHHLSKPQSKNEKQLAGESADDGILETADRVLTTTHENGILTHVIVLPAEARALKIGGPHYNCYVEKDGDQSNGFNGENLGAGDPLKPARAVQVGLWRTEVEPALSGKSTRFLNHTRFLNVLFARLAEDKTPLPVVEPYDAGPDADAVRVGNTVVFFARNAAPLRRVPFVDAVGRECIVFDAMPGAVYGDGHTRATASAEGVLHIEKTAAASGEFRIIER